MAALNEWPKNSWNSRKYLKENKSFGYFGEEYRGSSQFLSFQRTARKLAWLGGMRKKGSRRRVPEE